MLIEATLEYPLLAKIRTSDLPQQIVSETTNFDVTVISMICRIFVHIGIKLMRVL